MRAVVQRVDKALVTSNGRDIASIGRGLLVFVGIYVDDTEADRDYIINKLLKLRIFPGGNKNIDKSIIDIKGELLVVSQFTLYADCRKGNRPSFIHAMSPDKAAIFYESFIQMCKNLYPQTKSGIFGATMKVTLVNNGPVTIILDSKDCL
ncbi:D-tyrosyl-tRNA(Tyr) deacylase [Candidatus Dependentiae bacterium]|nr:MAG: D-tyrosyl-tRNA(Tyr) deacylase [Candidatus Dependentiae bacterium]